MLTGLFGATTLAWVYLVRMALAMGADGAMGASALVAMTRVHAWSAADFGFMFAMWAIMMVGMMVPSAAPMVLIYAAVARKASRQGDPLAPTAIFVAMEI